MVSLSQESIDEFRARTALETALSQLDSSWLILVDLRINGPNDATAADYVALHPRRGIALIDVILSRTGDPAQRLRKFLDGEHFSARFPGTLPIVRLVLRPTEATMFGRRVHAAFSTVPPITIADPNWMAAVNDLLVPADPSVPRPVLPLFKRSAVGVDRAAQQRSRERPRQPVGPDDTRANGAWAVTPERWPDKVAAATPLKRSGPQAPGVRPSNAAPSPSAPPPSAPPPSAPPSQPSQPRANARQTQPAPAAPLEAENLPADYRERAMPRPAEAAVPSEAVPPPSGNTISARREVTEPPEEPPVVQQAVPVDEQPTAEQEAWRTANPTADRSHDRLAGERHLQPISDQEVDPPQARSEPPLGSLARTGQQILSLVQFSTLHKSETQGQESRRTAKQRVDGADSADSPSADSPSIVGPILRLLTRQRERAPVPLAPIPGSAAAEPTVEPRYEPKHSALDSGLTAQRHDGFEDDFVEPPSASASWRGHAAAAVIVVALLGGGIAWLSSGDSTQKLVASLPGTSRVTPLPVAPPAADANATGGTSTPSVSTEASPRSSLPDSNSSAPAASPPATSPPAPSPTSVPAPVAATPAPPQPADSSVASLAMPPPAAPPWPKPKPAPPPAAAPKPTAAPNAAAAPDNVAKAPEPPAVEPKPVSPTPEPEAAPPRELAEKPAPTAHVARAAPPAKTTAVKTTARKVGKTERREERAAPAAAPPRELASRESSTRDMRGPPIDLADLPPGETVTPSSSPAPVERQSSAPTLASTGAARMHGPTSLLPPSPKAAGSAQAGSSEVCRSYTSTKTLLGQKRQVSGLACRDTSGQWQIITELPD